jgi:hypothetical protein
MYRQGIGDCLLVTLPRADGGDYFILIDCGVLLGTPNPADVMGRVLSDVAAASGNRLDLLVVTHEHWDHVSGFVQAAEVFQSLNVEQVWLSWAEDPNDELARKLAGEREAALRLLLVSARQLRVGGNTESSQEIEGLLDFFGAAGRLSTRDALEAVRSKTAQPRYCLPEDEPTMLADTGVRAYVLGPPRDEKLLKRTRPSSRGEEAYGLALATFQDNVGPVLDVDPSAPFSTLYAIPRLVAQEMPFFHRYWAEPWRRIDSSWLDEGATELALQLDSATNNTSLALAFELPDGAVLLFAADAQVGNWLSWQSLEWQVDGQTIAAPDLLRRTVLYKVGHHGSHNATLRQQGLEAMDALEVAMIPVFEEVARDRNWGRLPLPALVDRLEEKTQGRVLRSDRAAPDDLADRVVETDLYFEVTF